MVSNSMGVTAGGADAFLHFFGERAEMKIAGRNLRPSVGDSDQRLRQVCVLEASGLEHGASRGARKFPFLFHRCACNFGLFVFFAGTRTRHHKLGNRAGYRKPGILN